VKRNLDNYVPLATRNPTGSGNEAGSGAGKAVGGRRAAPLATGRVTKPKRGAQKRCEMGSRSRSSSKPLGCLLATRVVVARPRLPPPCCTTLLPPVPLPLLLLQCGL
jgi:hypothetical protein